MTVDDYLPLFATTRDCSPLFVLFETIRTIRTIRYSYSGLFAVRYSRLFAICYSGFPDTLNGNSGIAIPEAWIRTIKKHNSRSVRMRTYEGTASQSRNNSEDRNAPITADLCDINDTVQSVDLIA